jgi:hypothetical protein
LHSNVTPESEMLIHSYSSEKAAPSSKRISGDQIRNSCLGSKSMTTPKLEECLADWIYAECKESKPQTRQRFRELNVIFRDIYTDRRFWQYRNQGNCDYYEEALSRMWRYFRLNLCTVKTARKVGSFLDTRTYAVGRLLTNLKGQLKNIQIEISNQISGIFDLPTIDDDGIAHDPIVSLPNPEPDLAVRQFEAFLHLLETDLTGELAAEENTLRGKNNAYTLTAQQYLLMRNEKDMTLHQIADQLGIPRGSVLGGAKPTKWKELERKLAQMAIDSVSD